MKNYLKSIKYIQIILLGISIITLMTLPISLVFYPDFFSASLIQKLFSVSHWFLFFVMLIRPAADIFTKTKLIRPLVILRKGAGVISASIIVSFILAKLIVDPNDYLGSLLTLEYWSLVDYAVLAHMADLTAIVLLITSNNLSKKLLGLWWKKIQKLSYVYFYASSLYVLFLYGNIDVLIAVILVTLFTFIAFLKNLKRLEVSNEETRISVTQTT
ncbi:MAG: hypothetical protein AAB726_01565 [Patescibacteria group bacterium]